MKSVRFEDSSDDSEEGLLKMNYDDSESEEELSNLYRTNTNMSSSDDEPDDSETKGPATEMPSEIIDYRAPYKEDSVKRIDFLKACIEKIHSNTKIGDNNVLFTESKKLYDLYLKASKYFQNGVPNYFIRFLSRFEEYIENQWSTKNDLSTKNRKALPSLRAVMRPRFLEFREEIDKYRAQSDDKDIDDLFHDEEELEDKGDDSKKKRGSKKKREVPVAIATSSLFDDEEELTGALCLGKLTEIVAVKFKQRKILKQTFEQLEELLSIVKARGFSVALEMKITISMLELVDLFSSNSNLTPMKDTVWARFLSYFKNLLDYVENNPKIEMKTTLGSEDENLFEGNLIVHCSMMIMVEHLTTEYRKRLLAVDEFTLEFAERLNEEIEVIKICQRTRHYLKGKTYCADISILLLDFLHFKYSHLVDDEITTDLSASVEEYCADVFSEEDSSSVLSVRAVLYAVYHYSLHKRWNKAYELYSFSHVAELACAKTMDLVTQALYNRCLAQLGICAFLLGRFDDSYHCLADIAAHPQIGFLMGYEVSKEVATDGAVVRVPLHMHVSIRLVEYAYLVSALLVHVPQRILGNKRKRDLYIRHFETVLNTVEKTAIRGPPEDIWEHVVEAAHFLKDGNWKKCFYTIAEAHSTSRLLSLVLNPDEFKDILVSKIKRECLRMFLVSYGDVYTSISFKFLSDEYQLPLSTVQTIVGNMIVGGLLDAFVRNGFIIKSKQSKPSLLISSLVEKLNEQIIEK